MTRVVDNKTKEIQEEEKRKLIKFYEKHAPMYLEEGAEELPAIDEMYNRLLNEDAL